VNYPLYVFGCVALCAMFLGSGVYLVLTEHYWWAWVPFLLLTGMTFKPPAEPKPEPKSVILQPHAEGGDK
jgi:hypothetical protein